VQGVDPRLNMPLNDLFRSEPAGGGGSSAARSP
jgi:hypothetical protein